MNEMRKLKTMTLLREYRESRGLSVQELARRSNLPYSTVQAIETQRMSGSLRMRKKIADALNVPIGRIFPETVAEIMQILDEEKKYERRPKDKS